LTGKNKSKCGHVQVFISGKFRQSESGPDAHCQPEPSPSSVLQ
jgi:hypothetical protein